MTKIQIIGHKNPDTDATLSALIMQDFLTKKWYSVIAYIQGELNKETLYLLQKYQISKPEIKTSLDPALEVCLVDHNEASQSIDNILECNVTWLIDHHKIDFKTSNPLHMRIEPLCSTASIIYKMYQESAFEISKEVATLMLACIMRDSLLWKSPTTTDEDKKITEKLQEISGISDLESFAMPMFHAKSDVSDLSAKELIQYDYKIFETNWVKYGSGAIETTSGNSILERKEEILGWLIEIKSEQNLDFIMLSVIDILQEKNMTIVCDGKDSTIIQEVFWSQIINNVADLGNRLSRKKQIIPQLTDYFNSLS